MSKPLTIAEAYYNPGRLGVELYLGMREPGTGRRDMVTNAVLTSLELWEAQHETLVLSPEAAQALADSLWAAGYKPRGAEPAQGEVAAMKAHLADLRKMLSIA